MTQPTSNQTGGEFASLGEVADELGIDHALIPAVTRRFVEVDSDQQISALVWGQTEPEVVFLHGGGQNAHTWDPVALDLARAAVAVDLPGHGHSCWRADRDYGPVHNAAAVAAAIEQLAPHAAAVVGMSLGGLTAIRLAATRPELARRVMLVDVTPSSPQATRHMIAGQRGATVLIRRPRTFTSLEEMVEAAVRASSRRPASAVRRDAIHNSRQLPDGTWTWRYDLHGTHALRTATDYQPLWDDLGSLTMPSMLVRGGDSGFVTPDDIAEVTKRLPSIRVEVVPNAGHVIQSDQPTALSSLIRDFLTDGEGRGA